MVRLLVVGLTVLMGMPDSARASDDFQVDGLKDPEYTETFILGNLAFVIKRHQLVGGPKELEKAIAPAVAVQLGKPPTGVRELINMQLGGPQDLDFLDAASLRNWGEDGFFWFLTWWLSSAGTGGSGPPTEYHACVRGDGTVVQPQLFLSDYQYLESGTTNRDLLFSTLAFEDLAVPEGVQPPNEQQVRAAAERALAEALSNHKLAVRLRYAGIERQTFPTHPFDVQSPAPQAIWAVNFTDDPSPVKDGQNVNHFTIWVTNDLLTSDVTIDTWQAKRRRTKP